MPNGVGLNGSTTKLFTFLHASSVRFWMLAIHVQSADCIFAIIYVRACILFKYRFLVDRDLCVFL